MIEITYSSMWSLIPLFVTLAIAFKTRSAVFALLIGCITGVVLSGQNPATGFTDLLIESLGNAGFIKICLIIILIGVLFELFKDTGVINALTLKVSVKGSNRKSVQVTTWAMGFMIVDDYFSPLMTGAIMRPLSDKAKISREKLAFILDSTTASVCILVPFLAWGAYIVGLIVAQGGPITTFEQGMELFISSIPYNFYSILLIIFTLGICLNIIPDFGPMRKAEQRALKTGKLIRDGGMPLINTEVADMASSTETEAHLINDFLIPVILIFGIAIASLMFLSQILLVEAFLAAVTYLSISLYIKRKNTRIEDLSNLVIRGIKNVMPAIVIIALAYCIQTVIGNLGAANYLIRISEGFLTPSLLVASTFLLTALISFSTGTSWGAYALIIPISIPLAYHFTGGTVDPLVLKTVAAVAGGGIFGDHASPISDTSVLSSAGAGSDHLDHVITQLPYALLIAMFTVIFYVVI